MLQILFYLYCAIGLIIFSFGVWTEWLDPNEWKERKVRKNGTLLSTIARMILECS
jgi:hypothetical protein